MTPDEQAAPYKQKALARRLARTPEIATPRHEPLPGQGELSLRGWDLVTSRPVTAEDRERMDRQAEEEARERGGKPKGRVKGKRKGAKGDGGRND